MSNGNVTVPRIGSYTVTLPQAGKPVTAPVQIASFHGAFMIINLSTSAAVYIADNPTVTSGAGVRLAPGQGYRWVGSLATNEVWAILETGATTCSLVVSDQVDNYTGDPLALAVAILNSGVLVIDNPTLLFGPALNSVASQGFAANQLIDVRKYNSIYARTLYAAGSGTISFVWYSDNVNFIQVGSDSYGWVSGDNVTSSEQIPVCGAFLSIQWGWSQTNGFNLTVQGSNRPVPNMKQRISDRFLCSASASIASGATQSMTPLYRYDGPATVRATVGATVTANEGLELNVVDRVNGIAFAGQMQAVTQLVGHTFAIAFQQFVAPRNSWRVDIINRTSTTQTVQGVCIAAPESI